MYVVRFSLPVLPYALQIFECACLLSSCSGMTLFCLQVISPGMHACVHVGECMCLCIHGHMFTYLLSQQHPHNRLILSHFWKQLLFSVSTSGGFFYARPLGDQGTSIVKSTVDPTRKIAQILSFITTTTNLCQQNQLNPFSTHSIQVWFAPSFSSVRQDENDRY